VTGVLVGQPSAPGRALTPSVLQACSSRWLLHSWPDPCSPALRFKVAGSARNAPVGSARIMDPRWPGRVSSVIHLEDGRPLRSPGLRRPTEDARHHPFRPLPRIEQYLYQGHSAPVGYRACAFHAHADERMVRRVADWFLDPKFLSHIIRCCRLHTHNESFYNPVSHPLDQGVRFGVSCSKSATDNRPATSRYGLAEAARRLERSTGTEGSRLWAAPYARGLVDWNRA